MPVYHRVSGRIRGRGASFADATYSGLSFRTMLLALAAASAVRGTPSFASVPAHYDPPTVCVGVPDGTKIRLTHENAEHVISTQGLSEALVTCMNSEVRGPAVLDFTDFTKYHTTYFAPDLGALLAGTRRIETSGLELEWGWHVKLGGPVVVQDADGHEILRAEFRYGRPEGAFTSKSPADGTQTEGSFWYPQNGLAYLIGGLHGRVTSRYGDGTVARVGYWCGGFPIAKHYFFDRTGKLEKTEDYSESDYNRMSGRNAREILRPGEPPERVHETSAGIFHPLAPILLANLVRRTAYTDGRPAEIAIARGPAWAHRWIPLAPDSSVEDWFTAGKIVQFEGFEELPPATIRVSTAYRYLPLRLDQMDQNTDVGHAMIESCSEFFDQVRDLPAELGLRPESQE